MPAKGVIDYSFTLSSFLFLLVTIVISWSMLRGLNYYMSTKPFIKNLSSDDDETLVSETYREIVISNYEGNRCES